MFMKISFLKNKSEYHRATIRSITRKNFVYDMESCYNITSIIRNSSLYCVRSHILHISTVPSYFVVSRGACLILLQLECCMTKCYNSRARFDFVTTRWFRTICYNILSCSIRVAIELNKRREIRRQSSSGPSTCVVCGSSL